MSRPLMLAIALASIGGLAILTIHAAADRGFTILSALSLLVVGLLAVGIIGALLEHDDGGEE